MKPTLKLTTPLFNGQCGNPKCPVCGPKNKEVRELKTITGKQ